jgi:hypothetical protein
MEEIDDRILIIGLLVALGKIYSIGFLFAENLAIILNILIRVAVLTYAR